MEREFRRRTAAQGAEKEGTPSDAPESHLSAVLEGQERETKEKASPVVTDEVEEGFWRRVGCYLVEEEDASYLAVFRILWGAIMAYECTNLINNDYIKLIYHYYLNPFGYNFKYYGFDWVERMPFDYMVIYVWSLWVAALLITVGAKYRYAAVYFFIGTSYLFFLDAVNYLNHMYLVMCISFLLIFLPCDICFSIDAYKSGRNATKIATVPRYVLLFLKLVIVIVYEFAGVVKINEDWLRAEPLRHWLPYKRTAFGTLLFTESAAFFFSYGGMVYDLIIGPMLLWKPTLKLGVLLTICFHSMNKIVFNIGIFPYMMIASTSLFFPSYWPRKIWFKIRHPTQEFVEEVRPAPFRKVRLRRLKSKEKLVLVVMLLFLVVWVAFPLRHYLYPGDVVWNETGHVYSWRMKLRDKHCEGQVFGYQPSMGLAFEIPYQQLVGPLQSRKAFSRPWTMIQVAHWMGDIYTTNSSRPEVYIDCDCQVNYRPRQQYTDPTVDMGRADVWEWPTYSWIPPMEPLTEEDKELFPWNWEWNFNWLKGIDLNTRQLIKDERKEEKDGTKDRHVERRERFKRFMADKYFNGDEEAVGEIPRVPISSKRFTNRFAVEILRRDGYLTDRKSKTDPATGETEGDRSVSDPGDGEVEEEIRVKEPHLNSAREEALEAAVDELREKARANIAAHDV